MAAYPSLSLSRNTKVVPRMGVQVSTMVDGTFRGVALHSTESYDIMIEHELLSSADIDTLETFWVNNKYISWTFTWRGVTYNCRFLNKPQSWNPEALLWSASVKAIGTQAGGG